MRDEERHVEGMTELMRQRIVAAAAQVEAQFLAGTFDVPPTLEELAERRDFLMWEQELVEGS